LAAVARAAEQIEKKEKREVKATNLPTVQPGIRLGVKKPKHPSKKSFC